jgi:hypothetical protein
MTENETKIETENTVKGSRAPTTDDLQMDQSHLKAPRTMGDKAVVWMNDFGLNWLVNSIFSLTLTTQFSKHIEPSKWYQNIFNKLAKATTSKDADFETFYKKKRSMADMAETTVMVITGTVLLVPYNMIRANAQKLAYRFDKTFEKWGWQKKGTAAKKAEIRNESMDNPREEKPSWPDLIWARAAGLVVVVIVGLGLENHASGRWFSSIHKKAADKTHEVKKVPLYETQEVTVTEPIERGQNFKHFGLRLGRNISTKLQGTKFDKMLGNYFTTSNDPHILEPTGSEDFIRLVTKEAVLTGALAATMPIVLNLMDKVRGKKRDKKEGEKTPSEQKVESQKPQTAKSMNDTGEQLEDQGIAAAGSANSKHSSNHKPKGNNYVEKSQSTETAMESMQAV